MCPNWCNGYVIVKGNPKDIENFVKLFLFEDDTKDDSKGKNKYFARSFIHEDWKDFKKNNLGENEAEFSVDFAWSCWSCMFEGYPQDNPENCITLEQAMKKYNVEVEIETEEGGMGFEEKIITKNKKPIYESFDMPEYICQKCWKKQLIPNKSDLEDEECLECGAYGKWKDELTEIMKEKIEMINKKKENKTNLKEE